MSESREEFVLLVLDKFRSAIFNDSPMDSGRSIPEAITRWMALEFGRYLDTFVGLGLWTPVSVQCHFTDGTETWRFYIRVRDGGSVHFRVERQLVGQDTYRIDIGRGHNGRSFKRSVWGLISPPDLDNRITVITGLLERYDYNREGIPIPASISEQPWQQAH